jgi:hypothetical protein
MTHLTIVAVIFVDLSRVDKIKHLFKMLICSLDEIMARLWLALASIDLRDHPAEYSQAGRVTSWRLAQMRE